jgi:hypothetical protein
VPSPGFHPSTTPKKKKKIYKEQGDCLRKAKAWGPGRSDEKKTRVVRCTTIVEFEGQERWMETWCEQQVLSETCDLGTGCSVGHGV